MDGPTTYRGPSTDDTHEFLLDVWPDGTNHLSIRPLFAGQPDTAARWQPVAQHHLIPAAELGAGR